MPYNSSIESKIDDETTELGTQTASTASFVLLGKFSSIIFLGAAFIILARLLGPSEYGIYTLALGVAGFFGAVGNLGVSTAMNKFIPEHIYKKDKRALEELLANSFFVTIITGIALALVSVAFSGFMAVYIFHNSSYTLVIEVASVSILSSMLFGAAYSALLGFNKGKHIAVINTVQAVIQSVLAVSFVLLGFGAAGPILGMIIGYTAAFLYSIYLIYTGNGLKILVAPSAKAIRKIFSFSLPIAASNVLQTAAGNLSLIVLGAYATTVVIGNFGVASRTNGLIDIVAGSISVSLLSMYSSTLASKNISKKISKFYNYTIYYSFILLTPILLFIAALSKPFSYVAFSGVYSLAPVYITIMCMGTIVGMIGTYATTLLISANKVKQALKYNAAIALVEIALLFVFVPLFKGIGLVALIYGIVPLATSILFARASAKLFKLNFNFTKLYRILTANAVAMLIFLPLIILWGSNYIPLLITSMIGILVFYPALLALFRGIDRRDIKMMMTMTAKVPVVNVVLGRLLAYSSRFAG